MRYVVIAVTATLLSAPGLRAQDWSRYRPGTLQEVIDQHDASVHASGGGGIENWVISSKDFARRAHLTYLGEHRPMSPERVELLRRWVRVLGVNPAVLNQFANEYLFREGEREHWLAVQKVLEGPLDQEVLPGQPVDLYVVFIGGYYAGGPVTWLFLVNEFRTQGSGR
jgi:hypothetical protein